MLALALRLAAIAGDLPEVVTAAHFEDLRADHPRMRAFLHRMPKGGDLHTHLSGAVYAEHFIAWAVRDGLCLRRGDWTILPRPDGAAQDLDFHIREAVEVAGARRIGHGTAVAFERDMNGLLAEMRRRGVTIEIALTSSDVILGVHGKEHPITTYLKADVPVVLATDDAGVSRIDLSNEYYRAAHEHGLGYRKLKSFARNALIHAFRR